MGVKLPSFCGLCYIILVCVTLVSLYFDVLYTRGCTLRLTLQPITHFTQANILAIKSNNTGAIFHYEKALQYDSTYAEALNMLRNLKCVTKYHNDVDQQSGKVSLSWLSQRAIGVFLEYNVLSYSSVESLLQEKLIAINF